MSCLVQPGRLEPAHAHGIPARQRIDRTNKHSRGKNTPMSLKRHPSSIGRRVARFVVVCVLCVSTAKSTADPTPPPDEVIGITTPYRQATLASVQRGRIAAIEIVEGGEVQEGEIVFRLDDGVQRARVASAKAAAESTLEVALGRARWERAKRDLDRLTRLYGSDSASSKELSDAFADTDVTRLQYELAEFEHEQAMRALVSESRLLEEMHSAAPFTGYVTEHLKYEGESVDESEGVVTLVQLDPLKISVDCPIALAPSIRKGDRFRIRPVDGRWPPRFGTVVLAGRVADAASQTFRVKLAVDNEDGGWMAGLKVAVSFGAPVADGADPVDRRGSADRPDTRSP